MTQLISVSRPRDGQARFGQRCIDLALGLHDLGAAERAVRRASGTASCPVWCGRTGPTTCGITSPARWTITSSPSRMSLRLMSSSLCSVACETVTPPTSTGSSCAHGLSAPVRPTRMWILLQLRLRRHRRPLERARPARPLVQRAEAALLVERVDLDHDPVDLVVELDAPASPTRAHARRDLLDRLEPLRERVRAEAVLAQPLERLPLRLELEALALADAVDPDRRAAGSR